MGWIKKGYPQVSELGLIKDVEYVELPTGHWPQFTRPAELGAAILAAIDRLIAPALPSRLSWARDHSAPGSPPSSDARDAIRRNGTARRRRSSCSMT